MKSSHFASDENNSSDTGDTSLITGQASVDVNLVGMEGQTVGIDDVQTDSSHLTNPTSDATSEEEVEEDDEQDYHVADDDDDDSSDIAAEDDVADEEEINSLVKESQMSLDDLLASYGIPTSTATQPDVASNRTDTGHCTRARASRTAGRHHTVSTATVHDESTVSALNGGLARQESEDNAEKQIPEEGRDGKPNKRLVDDSALPAANSFIVASPNKRNRRTGTSSDFPTSVPVVGSPDENSASSLDPVLGQERCGSPTCSISNSPSVKVASQSTYLGPHSSQKKTHEHHHHHHHHHHRARQLLSRSSHTSPTRHQRLSSLNTTNGMGDSHSATLSSQRSSHRSPLSSRRRATSLSHCDDALDLRTVAVHLPGRRIRHESATDVEQPDVGQRTSLVSGTPKGQQVLSVNGQETDGPVGDKEALYEEDTEDDDELDEGDEDTPSKSANSAFTDVYPDHFWQRAIVDGDSSHSYNSDEDEDYSPSSASADDWRGEIRVGDEYQAQVPPSTAPTANWVNTLSDHNTAHRTNDEFASRLWQPGKLSEGDVVHYERLFAQALVYSLPSQRTVDDEEALFLLMQCNYNVDEALQRLSFRKVPPLEIPGYIDTWSEADALAFEKGFAIYNKDFRQIRETRLRHKTVGELVQYYYLWKKTARYDEFARVYRRDKKRSNPSITDFMDCLVIEQEAIADSYIAGPTTAAAPSATPTAPRSISVIGQPSGDLTAPQFIPSCYCPLSPLNTSVTTTASANPGAT